jgi:hypothetical protein
MNQLCFAEDKTTQLHHNLTLSILLPLRSPDTSPVRRKMIYSTSKDGFRRQLEGVHFEIQATDPTEIDIEELKTRANK